MWGRELRAGLAFVLLSLAAGAGVRAWRREHEVRFQELVEALVERDLALRERTARSAPGPEPSEPALTSPSRASSRAAGAAAALRPASLDIDRASAPQWIRLPGIGPSLAARIVADRKARGPFSAPEGLLRVPGIGPKILDKIRPYLASGASVDTTRDPADSAGRPSKPPN